MKLLVFLGNPGNEYARTRHNLAWMVLESISFYGELDWNSKFKSRFAKLQSLDAVILRPQTFMNKSGEAVAAAMKFFRIVADDVIVIHDELELPFGCIQLKKGGGAGGHNGLRSIIGLLGTADFYRFRLGISRPPARMGVASWVLGRFSVEEEAVLDDYCCKAVNVLEEIFYKGILPVSKTNLLA